MRYLSRVRSSLVADTVYNFLLGRKTPRFPVMPSELQAKYRMDFVDVNIVRRMLNKDCVEDGLILSYLGTYVVTVSPGRMVTGRNRFTFAHEAGHVALLHPDEFDRLALEDARKTNEMAERTIQTLEREADLFAAETLMPLSFVKGLNMTVQEIMEYFGVSREAAENRVTDALRAGNHRHFLSRENREGLFEYYKDFVAGVTARRKRQTVSG